MCYSISASMAPKLKVQPPELLGFGFPEAVHMQSSLRWDNNSASLSLLAMCYILDTECSLVEKQPKTVLQLFAAFCKHTFIFEFHCMQPFSVNFGLYQCFLKEENSQLHVCKDKVICILSCLSKVKVLHEELGPEGVFKKKKKVQSGLKSLQWNCVEQIQKKGAVTQPVSFALKETLGSSPLPPERTVFVLCPPRGIIKVPREGNHSYIFLPTAFSLFYYK